MTNTQALAAGRGRQLGRTLAALVLLLFGLTGCDEARQGFLMSLAQDWAMAHNLNPVGGDGAPNWSALATIATRAAGRSTGDPEVDAVLDVYTVIGNLKAADELMDVGRQGRNAASMDEAIRMRPGDATYLLSRGVLSLELGDVKQSRKEIGAAMSGAGVGRRVARLRSQEFAELNDLERRLNGSFRNGDQCRELYQSLVTLSGPGSGVVAPAGSGDMYQKKLQGCPP